MVTIAGQFSATGAVIYLPTVSLPSLGYDYGLTFLIHADICSLATKIWPASVSVSVSS